MHKGLPDLPDLPPTRERLEARVLWAHKEFKGSWEPLVLWAHKEFKGSWEPLVLWAHKEIKGLREPLVVWAHKEFKGSWEPLVLWAHKEIKGSWEPLEHREATARMGSVSPERTVAWGPRVRWGVQDRLQTQARPVLLVHRPQASWVRRVPRACLKLGREAKQVALEREVMQGSLTRGRKVIWEFQVFLS